MIKYLLFSLVLVVAGGSRGCGDKTADNDDIRVIQVGQSFELVAGQAVRLENAEWGFTFGGVVNDSRCPTGVNCIRAGEATVFFLTADGRRRELEVPAGSKGNPGINLGDYRILVESVDPYPTADAPKTLPEDYRIRLRVEPLPGGASAR